MNLGDKDGRFTSSFKDCLLDFWRTHVKRKGNTCWGRPFHKLQFQGRNELDATVALGCHASRMWEWALLFCENWNNGNMTVARVPKNPQRSPCFIFRRAVARSINSTWKFKLYINGPQWCPVNWQIMMLIDSHESRDRQLQSRGSGVSRDVCGRFDITRPFLYFILTSMRTCRKSCPLYLKEILLNMF